MDIRKKLINMNILAAIFLLTVYPLFFIFYFDLNLINNIYSDSSAIIIGACFTTASFIPQVFKSIFTRSTEDLSFFMLILNFLGAIIWLIFGIFKDNYILIAIAILEFILLMPIIYLKYKNIIWNRNLETAEQEYLDKNMPC